jgi:hypothetical protein
MGALFSKPSTPTPPNPIDTARAATGTNVSTAIANANLQNINQVTPAGALNYSTTGNYSFTDPTTGSTYQIPQFTATQTLSPQGQAIKAQTDATQYNLAGMANAQSQRVAGLLSSNMDTSGAPAGGNYQNILNVPQAATSFQGGGPIQQSLGPQGDITQSYGPADNFSADRQRVEDSLMARMNPQLQIEQQRVQQQLADQGIRYGSQAYSDAMRNYSQQADDARWGAIQNAGQEQQRMVTEAAQQAAFQNQAQQQGYEQALGQGQFFNQGQGQLFQQNAAQAAFNNSSRQLSTPRRPAAISTCRSSTRSAISRSTRSLRCCPVRRCSSPISSTPPARRSRPRISPAWSIRISSSSSAFISSSRRTRTSCSAASSASAPAR